MTRNSEKTWQRCGASGLLLCAGLLAACGNTELFQEESGTANHQESLTGCTQLVWPITGTVTQPTAPSPGHPGIDIGAGPGTPVYAAADGVVVAPVGPSGYGCNVVINHSGGSSLSSGYATIYGHLRQIVVTPGAILKQGTLIGSSGGAASDPCRGNATGPHLHFEIRNNDVPVRGWDGSVGLGSSVHALDPAPAVPGFPPCPPRTDPNNPVGSLDSVTGVGPEAIRIAGWSVDPNTLTRPIEIHVYVDAAGQSIGSAQSWRPDVAAAIPGAGNYHGFDMILTNIAAGSHHVCAYGINIGAGTANTQLGCQDITVDARNARSPYGALDNIDTPFGGGVRVSGWSIDDSYRTTPLQVHFYMDGPPGVGTGIAILDANQSRPDVAAAFPGAGDSHGFNRIVSPVPEGRHQICAYAINIGDGTQNPILGCRVLDVTAPNPFGALDLVAAVGPGAIRVSGWSADASALDKSIQIHVYLDGPPGKGIAILTADQSRADVDAVFPGVGVNHGFNSVIGGLDAGSHTVCAYGINILAGSENTQLGCRSVDIK